MSVLARVLIRKPAAAALINAIKLPTSRARSPSVHAGIGRCSGAVPVGRSVGQGNGAWTTWHRSQQRLTRGPDMGDNRVGPFREKHEWSSARRISVAEGRLHTMLTAGLRVMAGRDCDENVVACRIIN
jgi:hypothetical protein